MKQEVRAGQGHMKEIMETQFSSLAVKLVGWQKPMQTNQEVTKTTDLKANPEDVESQAEHWEVPKEHDAVKPVRGLR
jgi:hypothetical protein